MNKRIGFIGAGKMAKAMIGGIVKSGLVESKNIYASDLNKETLDNIKNEYSINITTDSEEVTKNSDIVIVAVKPNIYNTVLKDINDLVDNNKIIVFL